MVNVDQKADFLIKQIIKTLNRYVSTRNSKLKFDLYSNALLVTQNRKVWLNLDEMDFRFSLIFTKFCWA